MHAWKKISWCSNLEVCLKIDIMKIFKGCCRKLSFRDKIIKPLGKFTWLYLLIFENFVKLFLLKATPYIVLLLSKDIVLLYVDMLDCIVDVNVLVYNQR